MRSYITRSISIILIISIGLGFSIQGLLVTQNQSVSEMIQPGWEFTYDLYTNNTNYYRSFFSMRNTSDNSFLGLIDVWTTNYEIYDVIEQNYVTSVVSDSISLSTAMNGSYGTGYNGEALYVSVDFTNNQNITESYVNNQPITYSPVARTYTQSFSKNNTFFPLPLNYFPKPFVIDTTIIKLPLPVSWAIGNITSFPVNITTQTSSTHVTINSHDFTIDTFDVQIQETVSQWNNNSHYIHPINPFDIYYTLTTSYNVEIVLKYDRFNGMLVSYYYDVSLRIDYESTYRTDFSLANPQALFMQSGIQLNQNNNSIVEVTDNYYYYFKVTTNSSLTSIDHLYQQDTSSGTTSTSTSTSQETSTTSTSETTSSTNTSASTEINENVTNPTNNTGDTTVAQTPELNLPTMTLLYITSSFIIIGIIVRKTRK